MKNFLLITLLLGYTFTQAQVSEPLELEFTTYRINTSQCRGLLYKSGSRIYIPQDAFEKAGGEACEGTILIKYREMHTPLDFVLSNAPSWLHAGCITILDCASFSLSILSFH